MDASAVGPDFNVVYVDTQKFIWVKTSALDKAAIGRMRSKSTRLIPFFPQDLDLDESTNDEEEEDAKKGNVNWGWTRASIMPKEGDDAQKETSADIMVMVHDEENIYYRKTINLPPDSIENGDIAMDNSYEKDNYPDDLVTLTHLHEPAVLHCLRRRYAHDKIYTATGPILIAVNPFKDCSSLYSEDVMKKYWKRGAIKIPQSVLDRLFEQKETKEEKGGGGDSSGYGYLPPHIYRIADNAYRSMMNVMKKGKSSGREEESSEKCSQSVIISGESGSGKTVTTRLVMQYLTTLSRSLASSARPTESQRMSFRGIWIDVEQQVMESDPILESFGNARTIRNGNSSRFGKLVLINFNAKGYISGASTKTHLLEKVRLISQTKGERNYHVFYEMLKGMKENELEKFYLTGKTAEDFKMTNNSGTFDRGDGVDDASMYEDLLDAMDVVGFSFEEQDDIFGVACALLHASNLAFQTTAGDESEEGTTSEIDMSNESIQPFLSLMGIEADELNRNMCSFTIKAGKETHVKSLPKSKCEKGLEAFIKATYGALFNYVVKKINDSVSVSTKKSNGNAAENPYIGVLDIFGFESFEINSFEQLCINYCNETLQQQFNSLILKDEQEEYEREGISWSFISFPDNQDVLDLIEKKGTGIISLLSDQCRMPKTTDKSFANVMYKTCSNHDRFQANHRQVASLKFVVNHYAGLVEYDVEGFIGKNRDELPKGATDLLRSSTNKFINVLADIISNPPDRPSNQANSQRAGRMHNSSLGIPTVGETVKVQLRNLRRRISNTNPHYVRCLKPNDELVPDKFDPVMVLDQLRSGGVVEAVRVSRAGYPYHYSHEAFNARYGTLCPTKSSASSEKSSEVKSVDAIVGAIRTGILNGDKIFQAVSCSDFDSADIQIGKTIVFVRQRAFDILEALLIQKSTTRIQAKSRMYIARKSFFSACLSIILLQCHARRMIAKRKTEVIRRQKSSLSASSLPLVENDNEEQQEENCMSNSNVDTAPSAVKKEPEKASGHVPEEPVSLSDASSPLKGESKEEQQKENGISNSNTFLESSVVRREPEKADRERYITKEPAQISDEGVETLDTSESKKGALSSLWRGILLRSCCSRQSRS